MTKRTLSHIAAISILFVTLFSQAGCRENTIINTNITPAGDSLAIVGDVVELEAKTVYSHFQTNYYTTGQQVIMGLGVISNDPEIGATNASFYMQVVPKQSSGYVLPTNVDSFVVVLPYAKFAYGDTNGAVANQYKVYEVTDADFKYGEVYYDSTYKSYDSMNLLGQATVSWSAIKDSVTVGDVAVKVLPHLRIKLDSATMMSKLNSANYTSYADFINSFKGLHIKVSDLGNNNTIPYFRLSENASGNSYSRAGIVVYYHDAAAPTVAKSDVYGFGADNCGFFNRINTDISGSSAASTDTANYLFLQSRPGLSTEISTKNVALLPNRIVNKAEIVITEVASADTGKYFKPDWLYPYKINSDGALVTIADAVFTSSSGTSVSGLAFINGRAKRVTINGQAYNQYVINCPREFQKALIEKRDMTLRITGVTNGYIGAFRLRAGKKNNPVDPAFNIRMNVVYSGVQ